MLPAAVAEHVLPGGMHWAYWRARRGLINLRQRFAPNNTPFWYPQSSLNMIPSTGSSNRCWVDLHLVDGDALDQFVVEIRLAGSINRALSKPRSVHERSNKTPGEAGDQENGPAVFQMDCKGAPFQPGVNTAFRAQGNDSGQRTDS